MIGYKNLVGELGLFIEELNETHVNVRYSNEQKLHRVKVRNSSNGQYFILNNERYYLGDFIRV